MVGKFSKINEEFFLSKKGAKENPVVKITKVSARLMESYCKNLLSEEYMTVHPGEKDNFDFEFYKVKSITKIGSRKFDVVMETFDNTKKKLDELSYSLEV